MPKPLVPHRSGAHRVAAIALYRALLTQCRALPFTASTSTEAAGSQRDELQNIIRHRFKQARFSQSPLHLRISFDAGYEALDHLDASVTGDESSTEYIAALLQRAPARLKLPPPTRPLARKAEKTPTTQGKGTATSTIFDRPLPLSALTGRRHVPVLVNANAIPMLRIKKPQPESLSGYISHRLHKRQIRHDRRNQLLADRELAKHEDKWDDILNNQGAGEAGEHVEPRWVAGVERALKDVQKSLSDDKRKNKAVAIKMQAVVDREQALFDQEKLERESALTERFQKRNEDRESL